MVQLSAVDAQNLCRLYHINLFTYAIQCVTTLSMVITINLIKMREKKDICEKTSYDLSSLF